MQESTRQPLENWDVGAHLGFHPNLETCPSHAQTDEIGFSAPSSHLSAQLDFNNLWDGHSSLQKCQRWAFPTSLFPKRGTSRPSEGLIKSSRVKFCSLDNPPALPQYNILFQTAEFFFSLFSGAFLNIDINLLSWKQPKLLYFLSSPIVCTSDLFTKGPGLHSHKSWDSAVLWY